MPGGWETYYPRPQLRRASFYSLNGTWTLDGEDIALPWPPQSARSGYGRQVGRRLCYERTFSLPQGFAGPEERVMLHFGAVDQVAQVEVNGVEAARHEGGYLPFSVDVTGLLRPGENRLTLRAEDGLSRAYPYGKQCRRPHGMWYTPVSGVWQSVWMEAVPERHRIGELRIAPDLTGIDLAVETDAETYTVTVALEDGGEYRVTAGEKTLRIDLARPRLWTPDDPYLYSFTVETDTDRVESYFALRQVSTARIGGQTRLLLNGRPIFLQGVLDQGYFADGLFLPGEPEEYLRDVRRMKELGFNCLRKHIKVEPEAFYYACDRAGMLVIQDMVNSGGYSWLFDTVIPNFVCQRRPDRLPGSRRRRAFFEAHVRATQKHLYNHPCVVGYTIFNEGWGQYDSDRLYELCKEADPSRFYDSTSGWFAQKRSDVESVHLYFKNKPLSAGRPGQFLLLSECGGYVRRVAGHGSEGKRSYGYGKTDTREALMARVEALFREMVLPSIPEGLCGCIYTQLSDVEGEVNGLYTYDRQVCKVDKAVMRRLAGEASAALERCAGGEVAPGRGGGGPGGRRDG